MKPTTTARDEQRRSPSRCLSLSLSLARARARARSRSRSLYPITPYSAPCFAASSRGCGKIGSEPSQGVVPPCRVRFHRTSSCFLCTGRGAMAVCGAAGRSSRHRRGCGHSHLGCLGMPAPASHSFSDDSGSRESGSRPLPPLAHVRCCRPTSRSVDSDARAARARGDPAARAGSESRRDTQCVPRIRRSPARVSLSDR